MQIEILSATQNPMELISLAAGTCYGKHDYKPKRVKACFDRGHMSVFEHASVTFRVSGISRACSHQLVRHRVASFSQQSQRYCKIDFSSGDWFVYPPDVDIPAFASHMTECELRYKEALNNGMNPEDARYLLPEATKTEIVITMNVRELFHFFDMRLSKSAQWEIRELANAVLDEAYFINDQWAGLINLYRGNYHE